MPAAAPELMPFDLGLGLGVPTLVVEVPLDDELYPDPAVTVRGGPFREAVVELGLGVTVSAANGEGGTPISGLGVSGGGGEDDD